ncbi:hypothetical protein [Micromonospora inositola]|uniref:hypothetical protein n=1 Tax=Micromonospora inositola TaxID=47865 RepID=UPI0012FD1D50|nr:hypothetical protein [Micromonospora inositola]
MRWRWRPVTLGATTAVAGVAVGAVFGAVVVRDGPWGYGARPAPPPRSRTRRRIRTAAGTCRRTTAAAAVVTTAAAAVATVAGAAAVPEPLRQNAPYAQ